MSDIENNHRAWLEETLPSHARLAAAVASLLENMLQKRQIEYLTVAFRVKSLEGALEKIRRKEYANPKLELTDLSGIRVITYLEAQVSEIGSLISEIFEVDEKNSLDRTAELGHDRIGYRSTHFVCALGKERNRLPEYEAMGDLSFEIQVRTVLQHAWAELAHDRSFKFGIELPSKIHRKLNLYSGMLEIADNAFDAVSKEIDAYKAEIENKSIAEISDVEIDAITLKKFLQDLGEKLQIIVEGTPNKSVFSEMKAFKVKTIGDLEKLVTSDFVAAHKKTYHKTTTAIGLIRRLMMFSDLDHFFSYKPDFGGLNRQTVLLLREKYSRADIIKAARKAHVSVPST